MGSPKNKRYSPMGIASFPLLPHCISWKDVEIKHVDIAGFCEEEPVSFELLESETGHTQAFFLV